ncbi:MAG: hypothetical protein JWO04_1325 [Gammaproteobacteria bacterium]|nr:hypothetical protein [Gammaproteobacteria bacterium]
MRSGYSRTAGPACPIALEPSQIPQFPELPQVTRRHAMNSGVVTDIGKEASIARSGSTDDETKPTAGAQFAPYGRRSPNRATPLCSRVRPGVGPPPLRDYEVAFVSPPRGESAIGLRGIWRAGRFHGNSRRLRSTQWRGASMDSSNPENGWLRTTRWTTLAAQCDCNLHSSRAQFVEGANRVFDQQIDAS